MSDDEPPPRMVCGFALAEIRARAKPGLRIVAGTEVVPQRISKPFDTTVDGKSSSANWEERLTEEVRRFRAEPEPEPCHVCGPWAPEKRTC